MGPISPFEEFVRWLFLADTIAVIIPSIFIAAGVAYGAGIIWQSWDAWRANGPVYDAAEAARIARDPARRAERAAANREADDAARRRSGR